MALLTLGEQLGQRPFARPGEGDQSVGMAVEIHHGDMRLVFQRALEMRF